MDISNNTNYLSSPFFDDFDDETYNNGIKILTECYNECIGIEQNGGTKISTTSTVVSKIFSPRTKEAFTRAIRGVIRTGVGVSADIITVGAGGDIIVNAVFAIESSLSFLNNLQTLISTINEAKELFHQLIRIDFNKTIPIFSKLNLDNGLQSFEHKFEVIMSNHINQYGSVMLDKIHQTILNIIDKITTTVSDWIACLFPDTAGLAGEIAKTILDYIAQNGFTFTYNLISIIPDNMQKMITNSFALKKLIKHAITFLRDLIKNMNSQQIAQIIQALGVKASDLSKNIFIKNAVNVGTSVATEVANIGLKSLNFSQSVSFAPKAQDILIFVLDRYVIPNIGKGVVLFNQLFPLFLMFTLFIEKYPLIVSGQLIPSASVPISENQITDETTEENIPETTIPTESEETGTFVQQGITSDIMQGYLSSTKIPQKKKSRRKRKTTITGAPIVSPSKQKRQTRTTKKISITSNRKKERKARQKQSAKVIQRKTKEASEINLSEYNIFNEPENITPTVMTGPLTSEGKQQKKQITRQQKTQLQYTSPYRPPRQTRTRTTSRTTYKKGRKRFMDIY